MFFTISVFDLVSVLLLAFIIDLVAGEPPFALHPVVWMGKLISFFKEKVPSRNKRLYGIFMALCCFFFAAMIGIFATLILDSESIPALIRYLVAAWFLKITFAVRCLMDAGKEVYGELATGNLEEARRNLSMYVSRNTSKLTPEQVSSAVIETSSENFVDGILSPLFYFAVFGPFGIIAAYIYKAASTLDSMVGYRDPQYLQLGWFSAKSDDLLNLIPARLSIIPIITATMLLQLLPSFRRILYPAKAIKLAIEDGTKTPSPNSGYPMAAFAGAMNIRLEKPNVYTLGTLNPYPQFFHIKLARNLVLCSAVISVLMCASLLYITMNHFYVY
ncbi:MAG: cobalamin biosynthesis protein [Methanomethylovorans sp.]|jgi:adenosylcobinamide-phosphate synthase|nr:cobalamin biosynthesis protein [Methanomethylovorans sp.]